MSSVFCREIWVACAARSTLSVGNSQSHSNPLACTMRRRLLAAIRLLRNWLCLRTLRSQTQRELGNQDLQRRAIVSERRLDAFLRDQNQIETNRQQGPLVPKRFSHAAFDQVAFDRRTILLGNTRTASRFRDFVEVSKDQQVIGRRFAFPSIDPRVVGTATEMG